MMDDVLAARSDDQDNHDERADDYSGRTLFARGPFGDCSSSKLTR